MLYSMTPVEGTPSYCYALVTRGIKFNSIHVS